MTQISLRPVFCIRMVSSCLLVLLLTIEAASSQRIELRVNEPQDEQRQACRWPVIVGVCLPEGALSDTRHARVVNAQGEEVLSQLEAACRWRIDGESIQWLLVDTLMSLDGPRTEPLYLEYGPDVHHGAQSSELTLLEDDATYTVRTGKLQATVGKTAFRLFDSVRLDVDGDGSYRQDEELLDADEETGVYWVDPAGRRYDAAGDQGMLWEIEKQGPVRITLRGEGWYVGPGGEKVMKHVTRLRFHPDADWIRVYHTFIWTAGEEAPIGQITLASMLSSPAVETAFGLDGCQVAGNGDLRLLQESYSRLKWQAGDRNGEATRLDGWVEAATERGRVLAMVRDCPQQQPKGFEIRDGRLAVHLYPPHDKPLSMTEDARLTRQHRKYPQWQKARQYSFDPEDVHHYEPSGFAKTHELLYRFLPPDASPAAAPETNDLVQRPVVAFADPRKTCAAKPFGIYVPPRNRDRWPREEELIDSVYRWGSKYDEEMDQFEILNFGDVIWIQGTGRTAAHYRYWGNQCKGWVNTPWYLFARSGDRYYAVRGEQHARHVMDIDTVSHGARFGTWILPRVIGSQWEYCSVHFGWHTCLLGHWPQYRYLYLYYCMTGYERAGRMAGELEKSMLASLIDEATKSDEAFSKETPSGEIVPFDPDRHTLAAGERISGFSRAQYNTIRQLTDLAVAAGDRRFLDLAGRYQKVALLNRDAAGLFRGNDMNLFESQINYHLATGDRQTAEALVCHAQTHPNRNMLVDAYAYELTGRTEWLQRAVGALDMHCRTVDLGPDEFNRGAYVHGAQQARDQFFLAALATLGHLESTPDVVPRDPRGLMLDGGPEPPGTGARTGKFLRETFTLENEDGPFHLDVRTARTLNATIDLRVVAPSGKEVVRREMMPRIDRTQRQGVPSGSGPYTRVCRWRVDVPADGETGVYTVRATGQQPPGKFHDGFALGMASSTGKLVWHVPGNRFRLLGIAGGRVWIRPDPDHDTIRVESIFARVPYVVRLTDDAGNEVGCTESLGPDPDDDMAPTLPPIEAPTRGSRGLWSFTAAARQPMVLSVRGTEPFYSMSEQEWFDPGQHGSGDL